MNAPVTQATERASSALPSSAAQGCEPPGEASDSRLVWSACRGDRTACQELIRRYRDRVFLVVYSYVRDREEAQDITQETFLSMLEGLPHFREQARFFTWLHRIAVHRCIDWGRQRARRPRPLSLDDLREASGVEPADPRATACPFEVVMARELRRQIYTAITAVPEPFRKVVVLSDLEGLPAAEIARIMQCPVNTVKTRLHRGRLLIRKRLGAYLDLGT
jgi:RNA polymerase sigma-70 factor (ECF subfamily)